MVVTRSLALTHGHAPPSIVRGFVPLLYTSSIDCGTAPSQCYMPAIWHHGNVLTYTDNGFATCPTSTDRHYPAAMSPGSPWPLTGKGATGSSPFPPVYLLSHGFTHRLHHGIVPMRWHSTHLLMIPY